MTGVRHRPARQRRRSGAVRVRELHGRRPAHPAYRVAGAAHSHVRASSRAGEHTASKASLRVPADEAYRRLYFVDYFPSYEIISSASATRNYYAPDLREVEQRGVAHVMRCFSRHYIHGLAWQAHPARSVPVSRAIVDAIVPVQKSTDVA